MYNQRATILWNHQVGPSHHRIGIGCRAEFAEAVPGQFVMVRPAERPGPLLRRPYSIFNHIEAQGSTVGIELLVKVVGAGTRQLCDLAGGAPVDVLGPLGRGFRIPLHMKRAVLVAGGIGAAPIYFLALTMVKNGLPVDRQRVYLGARSDKELLCIADFEALGYNVTCTTDDGSAGDQCLITDPVEALVAAHRPDIVFACGPPAMLACLGGIVEKHQLACQVSIETMMACGVGACLGCAVPQRRSTAYFHACQDGPVFDWAAVELYAEGGV
jgi:dihydroorotate dehydrogenase electron transfer subunit